MQQHHRGDWHEAHPIEPCIGRDNQECHDKVGEKRGQVRAEERGPCNRRSVFRKRYERYMLEPPSTLPRALPNLDYVMGCVGHLGERRRPSGRGMVSGGGQGS